MQNLQAYFGHALISAYTTEKAIPSLGLFITDQCNVDNEYFRTSPFGSDLNFVYLNRDIERVCRDTDDTFPIAASDFVHLADGYPYLAWQVRFLKDIHAAMRNESSPTVRLKFLTAWDFYIKRYPNLLTQLAKNGFSLDTISPDFDFSEKIKALEEFVAEFGGKTVA